jgi:hypothetical protein
MPDGKRKRRHSGNAAKRRWYALHRARRFRRRFWLHPDYTGLMFGDIPPRAYSVPAIV